MLGYNTVWIANTVYTLDPNNSVIKRKWCMYGVRGDPLCMLHILWASTSAKIPSKTRAPKTTQISLQSCTVWSVFTASMKKLCIIGYPKHAQWRLRSDCTDFTGHTCLQVHFLIKQLIYSNFFTKMFHMNYLNEKILMRLQISSITSKRRIYPVPYITWIIYPVPYIT